MCLPAQRGERVHVVRPATVSPRPSRTPMSCWSATRKSPERGSFLSRTSTTSVFERDAARQLPDAQRELVRHAAPVDTSFTLAPLPVISCTADSERTVLTRPLEPLRTNPLNEGSV